jgi:hypothetical protein
MGDSFFRGQVRAGTEARPTKKIFSKGSAGWEAWATGENGFGKIPLNPPLEKGDLKDKILVQQLIEITCYLGLIILKREDFLQNRWDGCHNKNSRQ